MKKRQESQCVSLFGAILSIWGLVVKLHSLNLSPYKCLCVCVCVCALVCVCVCVCVRYCKRCIEGQLNYLYIAFCKNIGGIM